MIVDLAVANYDESTTSVFLRNGNGSFSQQTKLSNEVNVSNKLRLAPGDLNSDNILDIVVSNGKNNVGLLLRYSNGNFKNSKQIASKLDSIFRSFKLTINNIENHFIVRVLVQAIN